METEKYNPHKKSKNLTQAEFLRIDKIKADYRKIQNHMEKSKRGKK